MSQPLTISLTDHQFAVLVERAAAAGISPEACILEMAGLGELALSFSITAEKAPADVRRMFGSFNSGDPDSANNERIDSDIVSLDEHVSARPG